MNRAEVEMDQGWDGEESDNGMKNNIADYVL